MLPIHVKAKHPLFHLAAASAFSFGGGGRERATYFEEKTEGEEAAKLAFPNDCGGEVGLRKGVWGKGKEEEEWAGMSGE